MPYAPLNLTRKMSNGASVSDWLGTAKTAAEVAASNLSDARNGNAHPLESLDAAETYLRQALDEVITIREEVQR